MAEMVQIRTLKQMWNDYIYEGKKNGMKDDQIRRNLIEAFRKEIFGQIMDRAKVDDLEDLQHTKENSDIVNSVFRESMKKWKSLVRMTKKHLATALLIRENDLTLFDREEPEEEDDDDGYEIGEAEDPEDEEESDLEDNPDGSILIKGAEQTP